VRRTAVEEEEEEEKEDNFHSLFEKHKIWKHYRERHHTIINTLHIGNNADNDMVPVIVEL
jgi:hypothetical protein